MNQFYLNTAMPWPKHKGKTLREVIDSDLEYIKWLHRNRLINWNVSAFEYFCQQAGVLSGFRKMKRA